MLPKHFEYQRTYYSLLLLCVQPVHRTARVVRSLVRANATNARTATASIVLTLHASVRHFSFHFTELENSYIKVFFIFNTTYFLLTLFFADNIVLVLRKCCCACENDVSRQLIEEFLEYHDIGLHSVQKNIVFLFSSAAQFE